MKPIDRPFRFTLDFCLVWLTLAVPIYFLTRVWDTLHTAWSHCILLVLVSFFATFFVYGPVLLVRQIISSGSRGWFVARVFVTIVLVIALFFSVLTFLGHGKDISSLWAFVVAGVAGAYLHWRANET
jgi:hypothetical protein